MEDKFLKIAVTTQWALEGEAGRIVSLLLDEGFDYVHLRKPEWSPDHMEDLIRRIPSELHGRLVLHDCHELAPKYGLGGIHLNNHNLSPRDGVTYSVSCHSLEEIDKYPDARYLFLSPIFDSISKPGYLSAFDLYKIKPRITGKRVVALGGVTTDKIPLLKTAGFYGAAMLGGIWQHPTPN